MVVQLIDLLTLSTLICRGTDITKCFSESLGIRDNESRLYILEESKFNFRYVRLYNLDNPGEKCINYLQTDMRRLILVCTVC